MKLVFSRKGFDSSSGGAPSPIIDGRPISLPIPTQRRSGTSYEKIGLGPLVEEATRGKIGRRQACHEDPMFSGQGRCAFGQTGAAQSHLANQGVGVGDVFLFFGLFVDASGWKHHRFYGYLRIEEILRVGARPSLNTLDGFERRHPHLIGRWEASNTIYVGEGAQAARATPELCLTIGDSVSEWRVPPWLRSTGLTYHNKPERWLAPDRLRSVGRGQEFVADLSNTPAAQAWLDNILSQIRSRGAE